MILESLLELVETLKVRIDEHGDQLRGSEWLTRYALVDPLLRELGWDTEDPSLVIPEYQSGHGRADYALLGDGKAVMMVEAKKLGTQLQDSVLSQGINYCLMEGTNYFTVTDGQRWEVYETHKAVPIDQKRVVEIDLKDPSPATVCLKALVLWRPSVQSGSVAPGHESVVGSPEDSPVAPPPPVMVDPPPPPPPAGDWVPLTQIEVSKDMKPIELQFPDEASVPVPFWYSLMTESTSWLLYNGDLAHGFLPIQSAGKYLVSTTPTHPNGVQMTSDKEVGGLWVETNYNRSSCIKNAITIINSVGQDPGQFSVRFA